MLIFIIYSELKYKHSSSFDDVIFNQQIISFKPLKHVHTFTVNR